jgi:nitrogen fixation/metabolism regulation signal transduction histidine kinase
MLALTLMIGQEARLFSVLGVTLLLVILTLELFRKIFRTNRILESLLESIRYGDYTKTIHEKAGGLGFKGLAEAAQQIIRAIASARIEKETQYQYLQTILEHIHTAVITLDEQHQPELVNPLALHILGLYHTKRPAWTEIEKASSLFAETVLRMGESGREMIRMAHTPAGKQLLILVNTVKIGGRKVKIITFQDIEPEIEQKEMESWQTISRIMAHEIMNSLTPLSSLTETGIMMLQEDGKTRDISSLSQHTIDNLHQALRTIADRNRALTQFIGNYRQLSRLPPPEKERLHVSELLEDLNELYAGSFKKQGIRFTIRPGAMARLTITGDPAQLKQVMINLVKNGMEAVSETPDPCLTISVRRIMDHLSIEVKDNGPGIPAEILEKVFVPFFSTKPEGSGIGLSLSRQIIRNHGGQLSVTSEPGSGTCFRVALPVH